MKYSEGEKLDLQGREYIVYSTANDKGTDYYYLMSSCQPVNMVIGKDTGVPGAPLSILRQNQEMYDASDIFIKKYL